MTLLLLTPGAFFVVKKVCGKVCGKLFNKIVDKIVFVVYNRCRKDKYEPRIKETRRRT